VRPHGGPDAHGPARWDFSTNANAAGPCPAALAAVQAADCTRYPDPAHTAVRTALAALHGVAPWRVVIAASGSEAIQRLTAVSARLAPGPVAVPAHAYGDYAAAATAWGRALGSAGATLHWWADPSSPHGQDAAPVPFDGWGALDCAYAPLRLDGESPWRTADRDAVFQLWTPNKALGLTGVRGAYLIAPAAPHWQPAVAALEAAAPSWPLGAHGVALLTAWAQADVQAWVRASLTPLRAWRAAQTAWLDAMGIAHQPSAAPYRLVRVEAAPLRAHGIALRDATSFGLPGWSRLAVQPPEAQAALETAWRFMAPTSRPAPLQPGIGVDPALPVHSRAPPRGAATGRKRGGLMIWGVSSHAGKSWLATALCRLAARRGIAVVPFKAQNMSNHARVVEGLHGGWGEIGAAQYFQALAAGVAPHVDMNPVLLKPEADTASQVIVHGEVDARLTRLPWRARSRELAAHARASLARLQARHELIIIEGAGSPAEINLADTDYVNLETARWADAHALMVADIDRGGAFAHAYGSWALLPDDLRGRLTGFVFNKFRGDASLLAPGPELLQARTGVPLVGVLPMWREHGLPQEDGVFDATGQGGGARRIAVVCYPHASNLDEFEPLAHLAGWHLAWARDAGALAGAEVVILPGSKQVSGDLAWLRAQGLAAPLAAHAAAGRPLLGICGGLQMLGRSLADPQGIDGRPGTSEGLGLLPLHTRYDAHKRVRRAPLRLGATQGAWAAVAGVVADAYEIHHGVTDAVGEGAQAVLWDERQTPLGWQQGSVLGLYAHGLIESPIWLRAWLGAEVRTLDATFDRLADLVEAHLDAGWVGRWL